MPVLLQINTTSNWGSTGRIAENIGLAAMEAGWESLIAYGRMHTPSKSETLCTTRRTEVYAHYAAARAFDREGLCSPLAAGRLIRYIREIRPDVVHIHNIHGHWMNYRILFEYLNEAAVPVVWSTHDCWPITGHCYHFVHSGCDKWATGCSHCGHSDAFVDRSERNYNLKKSLFCAAELYPVVASKWLEGVYGRSFLGEKKISVIPNGIDTRIFRPCGEEAADGSFTIIGVATAWSDAKGLGDYARLASRLPEDCHIILVGLDPERGRALPSNVTCIAKTQNQAELARLYSSADVLLSLSYAESFGLTVAESFACGTPAIVYDNTAQPEHITPETGAVVPTGDIDALLARIQEFRDIGFKAAHTQDCRDRAVTYYDSKANFRKYIELYNDILVR